LNHFDAVVVHYSLIASHNSYVSAQARTTLAKYRGLKGIFIQDEYRFVDATIAAMREMGVDILFTNVPEAEYDKVYPPETLPGVTKVNVLTGYVPERLLSRPVRPYGERPIDVGYRARKVPAWLGELSFGKYEIGRIFRDDAVGDGLVLDISFREEDRLYGDDWIDFICRCKAMLGVETGASVFDFTGDIQRNVEDHVRRDPGVNFQTLRDLYFADVDGKIALNQISPRCFEAAALRTLMVMYEGDYSGRMQPWRHYVPLKKDHSNHAEVVAVLKDAARASEIVEAAYREVACNPRNMFRALATQFDDALSSRFHPGQRAALPRLNIRDFDRLSAPGWIARRRWVTRRIIEMKNQFLYSVLLGRAKPETRDMVHACLRYAFHPFFAVLGFVRSWRAR
jgi:hypothetical protein